MRQDSGASSQGRRDRQAMSMHRELTESQFVASPADTHRHLIREEHARTKKGDVVTRLVYRKPATPRQSSPATSPAKAGSAIPSPSTHAPQPPPASASPRDSTASHHTANRHAPALQLARENSGSISEMDHCEATPRLPGHSPAGAVHSSPTCSAHTESTTPCVEVSAADIVRISAARVSHTATPPQQRVPRIDPTSAPAFPVLGASPGSPAPTPSFPTLRSHQRRSASRESTRTASPAAGPAASRARSSVDRHRSPSNHTRQAALSLPRPPRHSPPHLPRGASIPASHATRSPSGSPPLKAPARAPLNTHQHTSPPHMPSAGRSSPAGGAASPQQRLRGMPITPAHAAAIARLHAQLDERNVSAGGSGRKALDGQYELLGPHERFVGGAVLLPMHVSLHVCADMVICLCMCEDAVVACAAAASPAYVRKDAFHALLICQPRRCNLRDPGFNICIHPPAAASHCTPVACTPPLDERRAARTRSSVCPSADSQSPSRILCVFHHRRKPATCMHAHGPRASTPSHEAPCM